MRNVLILVAVLAAAFFCWEGRLQIRTTLQRGWESVGKLIRQVKHNADGPHVGETGGSGTESGMMIGTGDGGPIFTARGGINQAFQLHCIDRD